MTRSIQRYLTIIVVEKSNTWFLTTMSRGKHGVWKPEKRVVAACKFRRYVRTPQSELSKAACVLFITHHNSTDSYNYSAFELVGGLVNNFRGERD